jgi:drug/metabolite transporter (DMT)-like permease
LETMPLKAWALTALALICFAGNSLLCRLALAEGHVDAASFTAVRLVSGALVLALLTFRRTSSQDAKSNSWLSALLLFGYAAPFSYAYLRLGAAMGALILFALVQVTMIGWGVARGERPSALAWLGIVVGIAGLVGLTLPGRNAPDPVGAAAMAMAGVAWGVYSLRGRRVSGDPVATTSSSFSRSLPFAALLMAFAFANLKTHVSTRGVVLAATSGALASGIGYAVWYAALPYLSATRAAVLQLLVPVLAALGAVAWLGERTSMRFIVASGAILGGVALTIRARRAPATAAVR